MPLELVVSDCPLPPDRAEAEAHAPPELPALSRILSRGSPSLSPLAWQRRLLAELGQGGVDQLSPAAVAGLEVPGAGKEGVWFAQPVHLQAATDHLRLPPQGLLRLAEDESAMLIEDFAKVFGVDGLTLHPSFGGLLLTGVVAPGGAIEPSRVVGGRVDTAHRGAAPELRRLASEVELWLYEHPVNQLRARRRQLAVNSLWFWGGEPGGGKAGAERATEPPARILAADAFLAGLATALAVQSAAPPATLDEIEDGTLDTTLVQVSARAGLDSIDRDWLQPALQAVREGRIARLRLQILDDAVTLTRFESLRFWRRHRPWWDTLRR
jgi:hypothetical protein